MTYDLRCESWIPWRRRSGIVQWGPPTALVARMSGPDADPVVAIAAPRPDFNGALAEFLIGLLSAALQPANEREWKARWDEPPTEEVLRNALDALPAAFNLDGDGPRFFQDLGIADFADVELAPVEQLLIDTPGDQGIRLNKDLFVKRARVEQLGRPAAAMALLTLQTYAPAGGQGHRTSLRGGGPLSTLVDPRVDAEGRSHADQRALWYKLWANVETAAQLAGRAPADAPSTLALAFPWLASTRTSNARAGGRATSPGDGHPLQAYFGMPRRIRLEFGDAGRCDLTGRDDKRTVTGFRMLNYGVQYEHWHHPLSPHYRKKPTEEWLPVHGQPGGLGWRDWAALTLQPSDDALREAAAAVRAFSRRGTDVGVRRAALHAFGYDMDNMKARGWVESNLPVFVCPPERARLLHDTAAALTEAASLAASVVFGAVKEALFQSADNAGGDLGHVRTELWSDTESAFYAVMHDLAASPVDEYTAAEEARRRCAVFAGVLRDAALAVFDRWCPAAGLEPAALRRRVTARYNLATMLMGYSKLGEQMFGLLGLTPPGGGREARAKAKRARSAANSSSGVSQTTKRSSRKKRSAKEGTE
ncbi:MAG TPA: type I-E CRISPR-associated protein Cse1/CasA [Gemmatimonadaceae bacterium]|nr:type I-E CRISPR-associated protein Cse1/CasA [Gemmatimonadaceae bacterium]